MSDPFDYLQRRIEPQRRWHATIHALLVWDEKPTGDGLGGLIEIINPTTLP